jgi:predicted HTH domain antitoxin
MVRENYEFLSKFTKEERSDLSKSVRELVTHGRVLPAIEKYRSGEISLGRAAEVAGFPIGRMMTVLAEFQVESRLEKQDYFAGGWRI